MKQIRIDAPEFKTVGESLPRIDSVEKLTGRAMFAEDIQPGGPILHGAVLRSPHAHARLTRLDVSQAEAMPGVRAVITAADLPDLRFGKFLRDERYMAREGGTVLYVGDRVAAVAADTLEMARGALEAIEAVYQPLEPITNCLRALEADAPLLHPELDSYQVVGLAAPAGGNCCSENMLERGDAEAGFAEAHRVFEQVYTTEMIHQAYMEPHGCLAIHNPDETYTIWSSTQTTAWLRNAVAETMGISQNRVRLVPTEIGGGFGGKISMIDEAAAATLARKSGMPVRMVMRRSEDFMATEPRSGFHITIKTGVSEDMRLVARTIDVVLDSGAFARGGVLMSASIPQFAEGPYAIPNLRVHVRCMYTNKAAAAAMRAPGGPQTNFALESETERIAEAMGWDAVEFRRRNLMPQDYKNLAGVTMQCVNAIETLEAALEASGYDPANVGNKTVQPGAARPETARGRGLGMGNWNVGGFPSGAVIKMNDDGSASIISGVVDLTGVNTALAQILTEVLELPMERVTIRTLDSESAPPATISAGSQALKSMGGAVYKAANHVRQQLFEEAVESLDASPERMELADGQVRVVGAPERTVPVTQLLGQAMMKQGPIVGYGSTGMFNRMPSFACHVADVEVDTETGQVKLLRYVAVQDCGIAINPAICDGQVQGGAVQGIGMALSEGFKYDAQGQPETAGFLDYKIPSALDLPDIETVLVEKPAVDGPFGAKGIGEPPNVPPPAAIANAIYNAVGVRITSLPITPEKVRAALREKEAGQTG
ncbi:MAG: xanthine dehydrogenase family protein molybdopterin-binding subunit [bacterium]